MPVDNVTACQSWSYCTLSNGHFYSKGPPDIFSTLCTCTQISVKIIGQNDLFFSLYSLYMIPEVTLNFVLIFSKISTHISQKVPISLVLLVRPKHELANMLLKHPRSYRTPTPHNATRTIHNSSGTLPTTFHPGCTGRVHTLSPRTSLGN